MDETIRCKRLEIGLSQKELADAIGVSAQFVQQLEAGTKHPSLATAIKLAAALGCALDELVRETARAGW